MDTQHHIVEKVRVHINVNSMSIAERVKSEISDFIQNEMLSILESYLTGVSKDFDDSIVQLDKVSLSVDTSSWNVHSNSLKTELREQIKKKLDPVIKEAKEKVLIRNKRENRSERLSSEEGASNVYGGDVRIIKSFFHFLDHGTLPWWIASNEESRTMLSETALKKTIEVNLTYVSLELNKRKGSDKVIDRLLKQYSLEFVTELLTIWLRGTWETDVNLTNIKTTRKAIAKIEAMPKEMFKKVLQLIWQLDKEGVKTLSRKEAKGILFEHIQTHFFAGRTEKVSLALRTTTGLVQILNESAKSKANPEILKYDLITAIHEQVDPQMWKKVVKTEAYKKLFAPLKIEFQEREDTGTNERNTAETSSREEESTIQLNQESTDAQEKSHLKKSEPSDLETPLETSNSNEEKLSTQQEKKQLERDSSISDSDLDSTKSSIEYPDENEAISGSNSKVENEVSISDEGVSSLRTNQQDVGNDLDVSNSPTENDLQQDDPTIDQDQSESKLERSLSNSEKNEVEDESNNLETRSEVNKAKELDKNLDFSSKNAIHLEEENQIESDLSADNFAKEQLDLKERENSQSQDNQNKAHLQTEEENRAESHLSTENLGKESNQVDEKGNANERSQSKSSDESHSLKSSESKESDAADLTEQNAKNVLDESRKNQKGKEADEQGSVVRSKKTETTNTINSSEDSKEMERDQSKSKIKEDNQSSSSLAKFKHALEDSSKKETSSKKKRNYDLPNEMFVGNAGLVLLNPFLPSLFKHLELVDENGKLIDPELAAAVLHFAATGRESDFEFEMAFEKYLCGIPLGISVEREIQLTEKHKEEVEKMLSAALKHWSALKSGSIELLRNEFLVRPGKLLIEKSGHRLIMEKKAFDILLDKLPWSYSMIKFSWLKELLFVEW